MLGRASLGRAGRTTANQHFQLQWAKQKRIMTCYDLFCIKLILTKKLELFCYFFLILDYNVGLNIFI